MKKKENISAEEIYKNNQKKAKLFKRLAPICFWGFLALSVISLLFAIRNSFGNLHEIVSMLDSKAYNGEQLSENYNFLIDKYGEWVIGSGSTGFTITFINVGRAVFNGFMATLAILSVLFFAGAFILGKWLLPKISAQILNDNQDMVNLTILKGKDKE